MFAATPSEYDFPSMPPTTVVSVNDGAGVGGGVGALGVVIEKSKYPEAGKYITGLKVDWFIALSR